METQSFSHTSRHIEANHPSANFTQGGGKSREFILFRKVQGAMRYVPNFGETCKGILDALMDEVDAENCSIMLKDPVSGELSIRAARGKHEENSVFYPNSSPKGKRFKPGEGVAGWVLGSVNYFV